MEENETKQIIKIEKMGKEIPECKEMGLHGIKSVFEKDIEITQTKFYKGSVRSGQKISFEGSLVIIGDVNAGAEVVAGENIAVVGALRGVAHAGAKGNSKAIISAVSIEAPQLRIANIVKELEQNSEVIEEESKIYAYISDNEIILE